MCYSPTNGISGRLFEETTLGLCRATCSSYLPRREAMTLVRKHQPAVKRPAALRLEAEVRRLLGKPVVFYTAVRSALDEFHSIDAFFELGEQVVTIDVTTNYHKCSGKADVVIQADDFEDLVALAGQIVRLFASKQERRASGTIRVWRAA